MRRDTKEREEVPFFPSDLRRDYSGEDTGGSSSRYQGLFGFSYTCVDTGMSPVIAVNARGRRRQRKEGQSMQKEKEVYLLIAFRVGFSHQPSISDSVEESLRGGARM